MKKYKSFLLIFCVIVGLTSCYQLDIKYPDSHYPVSFGQYIIGYDITQKKGPFSENIWVYHAGDWGQLPMGSREGLAHSDIWQYVFDTHLKSGEGIQYLKIHQLQTPLTLLIRLLTLGIISPTEIQIQGQIVTLVPKSEN